MVKNENFIMQAKESKTLQELNLTDDFLFDVATEELENCKAIIELTTGLRLKSLKWKSGQKVIHNLPGKRGVRLDFIAESEDGRIFDVEMQNRLHESIREIKASADMEVEYMKMEERERIIRDEGKQIGIINGKIEDILELLEDKGDVPEKVKAEILAETDLEVLKKWLRLAAKSETIEEFCKEIDH